MNIAELTLANHIIDLNASSDGVENDEIKFNNAHQIMRCVSASVPFTRVVRQSAIQNTTVFQGSVLPFQSTYSGRFCCGQHCAHQSYLCLPINFESLGGGWVRIIPFILDNFGVIGEIVVGGHSAATASAAAGSAPIRKAAATAIETVDADASASAAHVAVRGRRRTTVRPRNGRRRSAL